MPFHFNLPLSILCGECSWLSSVGEGHPSGVDDPINSHEEQRYSQSFLLLGLSGAELGDIRDHCHDAVLTPVNVMCVHVGKCVWIFTSDGVIICMLEINNENVITLVKRNKLFRYNFSCKRTHFFITLGLNLFVAMFFPTFLVQQNDGLQI